MRKRKRLASVVCDPLAFAQSRREDNGEDGRYKTRHEEVVFYFVLSGLCEGGIFCRPERSLRSEGSPRSDFLRMRQYYVYVMSNRTHVLYIGVTDDLDRRAGEHRQGVNPGFTQRYHLNRLVYFEAYDEIADAIAREKHLKGWRRSRKIALIESLNPRWSDLSRG